MSKKIVTVTYPRSVCVFLQTPDKGRELLATYEGEDRVEQAVERAILCSELLGEQLSIVHEQPNLH